MIPKSLDIQKSKHFFTIPRTKLERKAAAG